MFPRTRLRRLRSTPALRSLVAENRMSPADFIAPLFIIEGEDKREEIAFMPDCYRFTLDVLAEEVQILYALGIRSVLLFAKIADDLKDKTGTEALNPDGLIQRAIQTVRRAQPEMLVMTDVALDPYSIYGHDGIVVDQRIVNDKSVAVLAEMALSHARAGAHVVAPSDMMDGRVAAIRKILEEKGFVDTAIMSYSAKYASSFYGPFRHALGSTPGFGDKKTYQMDSANAVEALREARLDIDEGADIVMVKPGLSYLDILFRLKQALEVPLAVYQVSGEYSMLKAAAQRGWIDERAAVMESLIGFKRAGATVIATYFAKRAAQWL